MESGVLKTFIIFVNDNIIEKLEGYVRGFKFRTLKYRLGHIDPTFDLRMPDVCTCPEKIFLYGNSNILEKAKFIISPEGKSGRFIMKKESGAAQGLTVVTGNHSISPQIGQWHKQIFARREGDIDKDVVIEEDVWLGANVTLLSGVTVGRGSIIGANSVIRTKVPPYSIVTGNPAKVIAFKFTPEEIIQHESALYPEEERLPLSVLEKNYQKYYLKRIRAIKDMMF